MEEAEVEAEVVWMAQASSSVRGEVAARDDVMYCQKASLVHSP